MKVGEIVKRGSITTNPVFRQIIFAAWKGAGGKEVEPESLSIKSAQKLLKATVMDLFPGSAVPSPTALNLWKEMKGFGLAASEGRGTKCRLTIFNPYRFEWDTSLKARYKWLKELPTARTVEVERKKLSIPTVPTAPRKPKEITGQELVKCRKRLEEFQQSMTGFFEQKREALGESLEAHKMIVRNMEGIKDTSEAMFKEAQEILESFRELMRLEEEQLHLLQKPERKEKECEEK